MEGSQLTCLLRPLIYRRGALRVAMSCSGHSIKGALDVSFPPHEPQLGSCEVEYLGHFVVEGLKLNGELGWKPQLWESPKISRLKKKCGKSCNCATIVSSFSSCQVLQQRRRVPELLFSQTQKPRTSTCFAHISYIFYAYFLIHKNHIGQISGQLSQTVNTNSKRKNDSTAWLHSDLILLSFFSSLIDGGFHAARFRGSKRTKRASCT